jgi:hypothetical protein
MIYKPGVNSGAPSWLIIFQYYSYLHVNYYDCKDKTIIEFRFILKLTFQHFVWQKVKEIEVDHPMKVNNLFVIIIKTILILKTKNTPIF